MSTPSLARNFFERIVSDRDPLAAIRRLYDRDSPEFESEWLDFKTEHVDPSKRNTKGIWSKALGGFANNQGGVVLWGVDARKTKTPNGDIDAACGERLIESPLILKSRLTELQREATDPPVANVEIRPFEDPNASGQGFVVCYVPEGPFKPYRSEHADRQWWLRTCDNFIVMPRAVLSSMFHPRCKAVFRIRIGLRWDLTKYANVARIICEAELANEGTATAKDILVVVRHRGIPSKAEGHCFASNGWTKNRAEDSVELRTAISLHPTCMTPLFVLDYQVTANLGYSAGRQFYAPHCDVPSFEVEVYCENQGRQAFQIGFNWDEALHSAAHETITVGRPIE